MNTPRLYEVPTSGKSCSAFGGIDRTPNANLGRWSTATNLSCELYPTMLCCKSPVTLESGLDGNVLENKKIVAVASGHHPVFLDMYGLMYCNGYTLALGGPGKIAWEMDWDRTSTVCKPNISNASGSVTLSENMSYPVMDLVNESDLEKLKAGLLDEIVIKLRVISRSVDAISLGLVGADGRASAVNGSFADYGIQISFSNQTNVPYNDLPSTLFWVSVKLSLVTDFNQKKISLIRMGASVIIMPNGIRVNVVRLASGQSMRVEDVEILGYETETSYDELTGPATLSMCDASGTAYDGNDISFGDTPPENHDLLWRDTSSSGGGLYEWVESLSMWTKISSTYIKINHIDTAKTPTINSQVSARAVLRDGDVVTFSASYMPDFQDPGVVEALNGAHKIVKVLPSENALVINGLLIDREKTTTAEWTVSRKIPEMDFVVSAANRLWGCRFSEQDGINEIYASALGDPGNWEQYQGISTDAWRASRGTAAPYTGAAVYDGKPLFFRENYLDKVYPAANGAHQIQEFTIDGVEEGAADSLCLIDDKLFYKSRLGIMAYTGTLPQNISGRLSGFEFRGGSAGRNKKLYCLCTELSYSSDLTPLADEDHKMMLVYDTERGEWQIRTIFWDLPFTWQDELYYIRPERNVFSIQKLDGNYLDDQTWMAETAPQAIHYFGDSGSGAITEHKWISYIRIRMRKYQPSRVFGNNVPPPTLPLRGIHISDPAELKIYIAYEDDDFYLAKTIYVFPEKLRTAEIAIFPRRKDNFRLRLEGTGPIQIFDINYRMERSEGGH